MPSILDVAKQANVAVSTVSLVINHRDRVSDTTRRRVEEVIRQLNYRPRRHRNRQVQADPIKPTRTRQFGFIYTLEGVIDNVAGSYCMELVQGAQQELKDSGDTLSIFRGAEHIDHDPMIRDQLRTNSFDGLILFGPEHHNGYLEMLEQTNLPLVVFNRPPQRGRYSCVTLDYYGGRQQAIEHLIQLGHKRIAMTRFTAGKWLTTEQQLATVETLQAHDIEPIWLEPYPTKDVFPIDDPRRIEHLCRQLLETESTATVQHDRIAVACIDQLQQWGVRVPDDYSIVGYDNLNLPNQTGLSLTTIGYDKRYMGRTAIRILRQLTSPNRRIQWLAAAVPAALIKGQTAGPPPAKPAGLRRGRPLAAAM